MIEVSLGQSSVAGAAGAVVRDAGQASWIGSVIWLSVTVASVVATCVIRFGNTRRGQWRSCPSPVWAGRVVGECVSGRAGDRRPQAPSMGDVPYGPGKAVTPVRGGAARRNLDGTIRPPGSRFVGLPTRSAPNPLPKSDTEQEEGRERHTLPAFDLLFCWGD